MDDRVRGTFGGRPTGRDKASSRADRDKGADRQGEREGADKMTDSQKRIIIEALIYRPGVPGATAT